MDADDPYSRVDYRRLVAWPERIEREWPFLRQVLGAPGRLLDLGCGTGEHARFLASKGFDVTGIDASPAMIEKATDAPVPSNLRFLLGDLTETAALTSGLHDGAICLGNTLPHVAEALSLRRFADGLRQRLRPGAPLLVQILNYERIVGRRLRALPLNFRGPDEAGGEIVFLRLMTPLDDGRLVFTPTTLRYRPDGDPPLEVVSSRNVVLRAWRRAELEDVLRAAGFEAIEARGAFGDTPYVPLESNDLVLIAR